MVGAPGFTRRACRVGRRHLVPRGAMHARAASGQIVVVFFVCARGTRRGAACRILARRATVARATGPENDRYAL